MTDITQLDDVFHYLMNTWTGRSSAPHYTEIARAFSVPPVKARDWLHEIFALGVPGWLFPDTDYVAAMVPLSNIPTQYKVFVDGQPKGYASCGFDAPAVSWLFPRSLVRVEFPCLDCGEELSITVRDGNVFNSDPGDMFFYVDVPAQKWRSNLPYS